MIIEKKRKLDGNLCPECFKTLKNDQSFQTCKCGTKLLIADVEELTETIEIDDDINSWFDMAIIKHNENFYLFNKKV